MKQIGIILYDLDGTLVDSVRLIIETFKQTIKFHLPQSSFQEEEIISLIGPPLQQTFFQITQSTKLTNQMIKTYLEIYKKLEFSYISIYPNVISTLQYFKDNNFYQCIVTTKFKESALPSINYFKLNHYLNRIITLDDIKKPKPDPESIILAMSARPMENAIIIGDMPPDIQAGKNAKILTCGVNWSYKKQELHKLNPDFLIDDFHQLIELINKYNLEV